MKRGIQVGTTADGCRVNVEIALHPLDRSMQTINHDTAHEGLCLSITGEGYYPGDRAGDPSTAGQCVDLLGAITQPYGTWTLDEVHRLREVWQRWHLNDMRAGCAHQTTIVHEDSPYGRRIDLDATTAANNCPLCYRYGSAWLFEPLPDEVVEQVRKWQVRAGY